MSTGLKVCLQIYLSAMGNVHLQVGTGLKVCLQAHLTITGTSFKVCLQVNLSIMGRGVHLVEGMAGKHRSQSLLTGSPHYNRQRDVLGGGDGW